MDQRLEKLAVIHGSHTGDHAQYGGHGQVGRTGWRDRRCRSGADGGANLQARRNAWFAIDRAHDVTLTLFAQGLTAGTTVGRYGGLRMISAIHSEAPSFV